MGGGEQEAASFERARLPAAAAAAAPAARANGRPSPLAHNGPRRGREAITAALDACLCSEDEVAAARAGVLEDPLFGDDGEGGSDEEGSSGDDSSSESSADE